MARSARPTRRSSTSFAPASAWVGSLRGGEHARTVLGHAADDEVGPADVNAQNESHEFPPRLTTAATAAATDSTDSSRMQR